MNRLLSFGCEFIRYICPFRGFLILIYIYIYIYVYNTLIKSKMLFKFVKDRWFVYMIEVSPCIFIFFSQFMAVCWMTLCEFITVNSQHIKFIHCTIKIFWQQLWRRKHFSEADFITNSSTYRKGVPTWTGWMFYFEMLLTHTYTSSQKWWLSHGLETFHKQNKMQVP